jgi:MFS family permease
VSLRSLLVDLSPLRDSRPYRRLWVGTMLSGLGSQVASFALLYYVWTLTHNAALLGLVGVSQLVPLIVFSLLGGHLADRVDRRRLVLLTRGGQVIAAAGMATVVISGTHQLACLFSLVVLQSGLNALSAPASRAFIPQLLVPDQVGAGYALQNIGGQILLLGSPVLAGFAIAAWGVNVCFLLDALTFFAAIYGVFGLPSMPPTASPDGADDRSVVGGLRVVLRTPVLVGAFLADLNATVLSMPVAMFPVINSEKFGGSPVTLGFFLPSLALGGLLVGLVSGRVTSSRHPGILMLVGGLLWGASLAAFGAIDSLWVAIPFLAVAGAGDAMSVVARVRIVQLATPDAYRGRVNALDFVVGAGGPQLGNIRASLVAAASSGAESMIVGGIAASVGTILIAIFTPSLRRYRTPTPTLTPTPTPTPTPCA